ncbi:MAG: hypothetical protein AAGN64_11060 [Bacteroidota bacterium]
MNILSNRLFARALWVLPLLLLTICVSLVRAGMEQLEVLREGTTVSAEVVEVFTRERAEITYGELRLVATPPEATQPESLAVELPLTFLKDVEARDPETMDIVMTAGSEQVVLVPYQRQQVQLTFINAAMALVGFLGLAPMVFFWNRTLAREGDPANIVSTEST